MWNGNLSQPGEHGSTSDKKGGGDITHLMTQIKPSYFWRFQIAAH